MSVQPNKWHHRDHHANPQEVQRDGWKHAHKDWRVWFVVAIMLAAILTYVMTMDESVQPGGKMQPMAPADTGP